MLLNHELLRRRLLRYYSYRTCTTREECITIFPFRSQLCYWKTLQCWIIWNISHKMSFPIHIFKSKHIFFTHFFSSKIQQGPSYWTMNLNLDWCVQKAKDFHLWKLRVNLWRVDISVKMQSFTRKETRKQSMSHDEETLYLF